MEVAWEVQVERVVQLPVLVAQEQCQTFPWVEVEWVAWEEVLLAACKQ